MESFIIRRERTTGKERVASSTMHLLETSIKDKKEKRKNAAAQHYDVMVVSALTT